MEDVSYKLNEKELLALSACLVYTQRKKDELTTIIRGVGNFSITINEFTQELEQIRMPLHNKEFKSHFLDKMLLDKLDAFNPLKYLQDGKTKVELKDYLLMLDLNVRVLQDLELEVLKGNRVR